MRLKRNANAGGVQSVPYPHPAHWWEIFFRTLSLIAVDDAITSTFRQSGRGE